MSDDSTQTEGTMAALQAIARLPELVAALKAWQFYYAGHSTSESRDKAYFQARALLQEIEP